MTEQLYPKVRQAKVEKPKSWRVDYSLIYDNGVVDFHKFYHWRTTARLFAFVHYYIGSYGGTASLTKVKD